MASEDLKEPREDSLQLFDFRGCQLDKHVLQQLLYLNVLLRVDS